MACRTSEGRSLLEVEDEDEVLSALERRRGCGREWRKCIFEIFGVVLELCSGVVGVLVWSSVGSSVS